MVSVFKKGVLDYLNHINSIPYYHGPAGLHHGRHGSIPGHRTCYRWHKELQGLLEFYPNADFSSLGLIHAHVVLLDAGEEMLYFPAAVESCWLMGQGCSKALYLHCLLPRRFKDDIQEVFERLKNNGWISSFACIFSGDGHQLVQNLGKCLDGSGRICWAEDALRIRAALSGEDDNCLGLLKAYPFIVPVLFENYGRHLSLVELWKIIHGRLGRYVWRYLPKEKKLPVNGKAYIKKAFKLLGDWRVFRQNIVKYKPLLDHHIEVFLFIDNRDLFPLLDCVGRFCLMAEFYSGMEDKAVVRLIGDVNLLYGLMDFRASEEMQMFFFDKRKTWESPGVRFAYEDLFNSKTGEWTFDKDKILKNMEVQRDGG